MSWSQLHGGAHRHRKVSRLAKALSISILEARGIALTIWSWATETEPDGDLSDYAADELADAWGWPGDPDALLSALVEVGLLDQPSKGVLGVHDWMHYAAGWREAARSRQRREAKKTNDSNTDQVATGTRPGRDRDATRREERRGEEKRGEDQSASVNHPTPEPPTVPTAAPPPSAGLVCREDEFIALWNAATTTAPKLRPVTQLSGLEVAWLHEAAQTATWWAETIAQVPRSAWLRGDKRAWRADPKWLLKDRDNAEKTRRGHYSDAADAAAREAIAPSIARDPKTREARDLTHAKRPVPTTPPPEVLNLFAARSREPQPPDDAQRDEVEP